MLRASLSYGKLMQNKNIMRKSNNVPSKRPNYVLEHFTSLSKGYLSSLPYYIFSSGPAFFVDLAIYTSLHPILGTNFSAVLSFLGGTAVLYFLLRLTRASKITSKREGFALQLLIGIGSLVINLLSLNLLDFAHSALIGSTSINFLSGNAYAFASKIIASTFGFIWTSSMTMKKVFTLRKSRGYVED